MVVGGGSEERADNFLGLAGVSETRKGFTSRSPSSSVTVPRGRHLDRHLSPFDRGRPFPDLPEINLTFGLFRLCNGNVLLLSADWLNIHTMNRYKGYYVKGIKNDPKFIDGVVCQGIKKTQKGLQQKMREPIHQSKP